MISALNERATLQNPNKLPNGQGGFKIDRENPHIIGEYWVNVKILVKGSEIKEALNYEITARKNNRISKKSQVVWKDKVLEVDEVVPGAPGYILIYAREVQV